MSIYVYGCICLLNVLCLLFQCIQKYCQHAPGHHVSRLNVKIVHWTPFIFYFSCFIHLNNYLLNTSTCFCKYPLSLLTVIVDNETFIILKVLFLLCYEMSQKHIHLQWISFIFLLQKTLVKESKEACKVILSLSFTLPPTSLCILFYYNLLPLFLLLLYW